MTDCDLPMRRAPIPAVKAGHNLPASSLPDLILASPIPRTKIVCTLGPASASEAVIKSLMQAGLDVARINFSHGTHEEHAATIALVRSRATSLSRPVAILGDLQGPRIRIGDLAEPLELKAGDDIVLVARSRRGRGRRSRHVRGARATTSTWAIAFSWTTV